MTVASIQAVPVWKRRPVWIVAGSVLGLAALGAVALGMLAAGGAAPAPASAGETTQAVRGSFVATITESGEVDAKRSTDVRCEVEGQSTIVSVIEEGTVVKKGDKLIQLDAADLAEKLQTQDMAHKTAKATFGKADQAYLIQQSTRESLLAAAALKTKFALMDLRKYLGADLGDRLIQAQGSIPVEDLLQDKDLGGAALQEQRKLQTDIALASQEMERSMDKVEWTQKLKDKGYVTGSELKADQLDLERKKVLLAQARTALELFLQYDFAKASEKGYTDWLEAKREYDRVDARTNSELETAKATRDVAEQAFALEEIQLKKAQDQVAKCTIHAPQPGMVVYDTSGNRFGQNTVIEAGATVRHQQTLLKLPDLSEMNVKAKIHESVVKQVTEKAPAYITIDALPGERLTGTVTKVAVMPDRGNWWLNPGLKTYITEVTLDRTPPGLKPGMSAQVEILVDSRDDVLQVPVSAVFVEKGFQVVYAKTPAGIETRRVEVGLSNDKVVEILKGIETGEVVYLYKPPGAPELAVSAEEAAPALEFKRPPEADADAGRPDLRRTEAADETPKADVKVPGMADLSPEKLKEMREKFEQMSPEEREKVLKRIRDAAQQGLGTPGGTGSETPGGAERPGAPDRPRGTDRPRGGARPAEGEARP